jgi:sortase A
MDTPSGSLPTRAEASPDRSGSSTPVKGSGPRIAEVAAWTIGLALLALYVGTRAHQTTASQNGVREFARIRSLAWGAPNQSLWSPERVKAWQESLRAAPARPMAILRIRRIGLEVPVYEGTDDATLDRGAGHIDGTPVPGAQGNVGIAGHRDGFFRVLKDLVAGDVIELETLARTDRFSVESTVIVAPDDVWVLDATASPRLTLVTCYPFYYAGSAPQRFIVRGLPLRASP